MRVSLALLLLIGMSTACGCGKAEDEFDITKDPNYHANPDPRSYSNFYDNTPLDKTKPAKKGQKPK